MASCLQVENLTKSYGEQVLFENISCTIEEGRRVALVAKNGTGKTTLLNIIAGKESHDAGSVVPRRGLRIAYLEQSPAYPAGMTVLEACFHSESPALKAIAEYERAIGDASGEGLQEAMPRNLHKDILVYSEKRFLCFLPPALLTLRVHSQLVELSVRIDSK